MNINEIEKNFSVVARKYDSMRRCFIPGFDDYYVTSLSLLKTIRDRFEHILDLGAGTGLLANSLYQFYPDASYTLVDISEEMLKVARERFKGLDNFTFEVCDYTKKIPDNHHDLICSALSIHHLTEEAKLRVYKSSFDNLTKDGCFINLDQFVASDQTINRHYENWWLDYINNSGIPDQDKKAWLKRKELDIENSIEDTINLLKKAGFTKVEPVYHFMKFGVVLAIK